MQNSQRALLGQASRAHAHRHPLSWEPRWLLPTDLQSDPVLHQQSNLDVHQVQVFLQLLVGPDLRHHFFAQPRYLQLLLEIQVALVQ